MPQIRQPLDYWLALKFVPRLSVKKKLELVEQLGLTALFTQPLPSHYKLTDKQQAAIESPDWQKIETVIEQTQQHGCLAIGYSDDLYPKRLQQIYDPPLVLFVRGNVELLSSEQLAIVGSRNASVSAREFTKAITRDLSLAGLTITSGLALGIDGFAHRACLASSGATVAVVATGLDTVYPSRHRSLAHSIIEQGGAIVSEFLPGTPARAGHFPKRNRLISGLSLAVLLVEAGLPSGSLITAKMALEQNRDVFAVPGAVNNPLAKGCHWLIKQGAFLTESADDILSQLDFQSDSGRINNSDSQQRMKVEKNEQQSLFLDPLLASVGYETTPVDVIVSRSRLSANDALTRLTLLELKGLVAAVPGGYLRLDRG